MKMALITTTIHVPEVLPYYRGLDSTVPFFVAGDMKTPESFVRPFIESLGNAVYLSPSDQEKLDYESSKLIGWNKIMRRNIALLEAIKSGAEIIISIDDDNIPVNTSYFDDFHGLFSSPFSGLQVSSKSGWVNAGQFLSPPVIHRGLPYEKRPTSSEIELGGTQSAKVGVASGLWFGDPDIDCIDRLVNHPIVLNVSDVLSAGFVVHKDCRAPFNSQNTAYRAELAPLMMVLIDVGRYDDIWASYISQTIFTKMEYQIHFGKPFVWQERNPQNLWQNLRDEIYGMENTPAFVAKLKQLGVDSQSDVLENLQRVYSGLKNEEYFPKAGIDLGLAWCRDCAKAMARR